MKRILAVAVVWFGLAGSAVAEEARPLRLEAVDDVIEKSDRAVQACGKGGRRDALAVLLHLDIDADGRVLTVSPTAEKIPPEASCLARVARHLRFPATGTVSHVEYPFILTPQLRR